MGMNVGSGNGSGNTEVMADINTTPLIDVMLVLLIMLIITIPVQLHAVTLNLPTQVPAAPPPTPPEVVRIDVDAAGLVYWNGEALADAPALEQRLQALTVLADPPELHLRPHRDVPYDAVTRVLAAAQRLGLRKLGITGNEQFL